MQGIHVAVGVILDDLGQVLLSFRHPDSHQGGLWEFPGGKLEAGETVQTALGRELAEELGIQVLVTEPLITVKHDYSDKRVLLDVWLVHSFSGEAESREQQPVRWVPIAELANYRFPAANRPIVQAIKQWLDH